MQFHGIFFYLFHEIYLLISRVFLSGLFYIFWPAVLQQCIEISINNYIAKQYLAGMMGTCLLLVHEIWWLTIISRYLTKVVSWRCLEYWSPSSKGLTRVRSGTTFSLKIFNSGISLRDKAWKVVQMKEATSLEGSNQVL